MEDITYTDLRSGIQIPNIRSYYINKYNEYYTLQFNYCGGGESATYKILNKDADEFFKKFVEGMETASNKPHGLIHFLNNKDGYVYDVIFTPAVKKQKTKK